MAKRQIPIKYWGRGVEELRFARYALCAGDDRPHEAVARSIARTTGLEWTSLRFDGLAVSSSGTSKHWCGTLGKPLRSGGWSPVAEVWFSIPLGGKS